MMFSLHTDYYMVETKCHGREDRYTNIFRQEWGLDAPWLKCPFQLFGENIVSRHQIQRCQVPLKNRQI